MPTAAVIEIANRFSSAVQESFSFLVSEFGFTDAGSKLVDVADAREQAVVARYHKGLTRIEIRMSVIPLTISVFSSRYETIADCLNDARPTTVLNLETACPGTGSPDRPRWMKQTTLRGEALAGFKRYAKLMKQHLEEGVDFLGARLRTCATEMGLRD